MDKLRKSVENFLSLERIMADGSAAFFHKVVAGMHELCFAIVEAEKSGVPRNEIETVIRPARDIHSRSVFVKRLQDWPRKYPGDFETIEYICNLENKSHYGKLEYYIEEYALNSAMAQQYRNSIQGQSEILLDTLLNGTPNKRILSVGCGGCRDILKIVKYIADIPCELVLHDIDSDALALSEKRLEEIRGRVHMVSGNFLQSMRKIEKLGPFDLILAGGLFNFLSDNHISFFLKQALNKLLRPNSTLFFGNVKKDNPYKVWQEYLASWKLMYRDEDDITRLLTSSGFSNDNFHIEKDETGLTFLVSARTKPNGS